MGFLVRNEPRGDFGACPRRNDGFAAVALIAARQAVDLESWPRRPLFLPGKIRARRKVSGLRAVLILAVVLRNALELLSLVRRRAARTPS